MKVAMGCIPSKDFSDAVEYKDGTKYWYLNGKFIHGKSPRGIWFFQTEKYFFLDICSSQIEFLNVVREDGVWRADKEERDSINA